MLRKMLILSLSIILFGYSHCEKKNTHQFQLADNKVHLDRGKTQLEELERKASLPRHSSCWRDAVASLRTKCASTNDEDQSFLAVHLTNCHLQKSGLNTFPCKETDSIKDCTLPMAKESMAYIVYTEFFTHVTDICFYLQSELWREETSKTISKLTKTSSNIADKLNESLVQQSNLLVGQDKSLKNQEEIIKSENYLRMSLKDSSETVQQSFAKIREEASKQKTMYTDTFNALFQSVERLTRLQNMLLGEFMSLQSVAFYLICIIASYLFTSTSRTSGARLPLFILLTALIFLERCLTNYSFSGNGGDATLTENLHQKIWLLRKGFLLIMTLVFGYIAVSYRDLNKVNNKMLQSIEHHILEIKKLQMVNVTHELPVYLKEHHSIPRPLVKNDETDNIEEAVNVTTADFQCNLTELSDAEDGIENPRNSSSIIDSTPVNSHKIVNETDKKNPRKYCSTDPVAHRRRQKRIEKRSSLVMSSVTYSLRSRSRDSIETVADSSSPANVSNPKSATNTKPRSRRTVSNKSKNTSGHKSRGFFSSDDED